MRFVLKKKCAFVERIKVSSFLFELCFFADQKQNLNKCLNISFLFSETKNVTVSHKCYKMNECICEEVGENLVDRATESPFETMI